ncbi:uncharacterized protein N7515_001755 [Penicillium bovifimosum]|uniref:Uncharacterized protein n=1 Tax=Penicillium bovifimosum TaxID=126998 RepID=A0A9W9L8L2_9EURO|nr:uncharacterized protein N7515_001755 [Penicillium bovifimosum]KAJ5142968.1 hypothetical protein N7515_001755 [Penicillium bovifimosum]
MPTKRSSIQKVLEYLQQVFKKTGNIQVALSVTPNPAKQTIETAHIDSPTDAQDASKCFTSENC